MSFLIEKFQALAPGFHSYSVFHDNLPLCKAVQTVGLPPDNRLEVSFYRLYLKNRELYNYGLCYDCLLVLEKIHHERFA